MPQTHDAASPNDFHATEVSFSGKLLGVPRKHAGKLVEVADEASDPT